MALRHVPICRPLASANVRLGSANEDLRIDLACCSADKPSDLTDYLFPELLLWATSHGLHHRSEWWLVRAATYRWMRPGAWQTRPHVDRYSNRVSPGHP